jgi:CheY-like chemotaxis protein
LRAFLRVATPVPGVGHPDAGDERARASEPSAIGGLRPSDRFHHTAYSEEEVRQEALAYGAIDVLYKPLRPAVLLDAIYRALRS